MWIILGSWCLAIQLITSRTQRHSWSLEVVSKEKEAIRFLRESIVQALTKYWSVPSDLLQTIPLAVLAQVTPASPVSLIGCPSGTFPFDLTSCTRGLESYAEIQGRCLNPAATYDFLMRSCVTHTTVEAVTACPEGFRITLFPTGVTRGPCQRDDVITGIPTCDPPYLYSKTENICLLHRPALGYVGCRPGELRRGNRCLLAYQVPMEIKCPDGYQPKTISAEWPLCEKTLRYAGRWNRYASRAICKSDVATAIVEHVQEHDWLNPHEVLYPHAVSVVPNVTCEEKHTLPATAASCPENTTDYHTYIQRGNLPPVQFHSALGHPKWTCVILRSLPLEPACPHPEQAVFFDASRDVLSKYKQLLSSLPSNASTSFVDAPSDAIYDEPESPETPAIDTSPLTAAATLANADPTRLRRLSKRDTPENNLGHRRRAKDNWLGARSLDTIYDNVEHLPDTVIPYDSVSVEKSLLNVDWEAVIPADLFIQRAYEHGIRHINWTEPYALGKLRVICRTTSRAQYYLTCPTQYRLRKDGTCKGNGYANFVVACPEGFALDQYALARGSYISPQPKCRGRIPTTTRYSCPSVDSMKATAATNSTSRFLSQLETDSTILRNLQDSNITVLHDELKDLVQLLNKMDTPPPMTPLELLKNFPDYKALRDATNTSHQRLREKSPTTTLANLDSQYIRTLLLGSDKFAANLSYEAPLQLFQDEHMKTCYSARLYPAYFSPSEDLIVGLFGHTFGGRFLDLVALSKRLGGSPFYPLIPNLGPSVNSTLTYQRWQELSVFDKLQQLPQFRSFYRSAFTL